MLQFAVNGLFLFVGLLLGIMCSMNNEGVKMSSDLELQSSSGVNVQKMSNAMEILRSQCATDQTRILNVLEPSIQMYQNPNSHLFSISYWPVQTNCLVKGNFGGVFMDMSFYDGNKYVCLDNFPILDPASKSPECLIYSFGLNTETSFEEEFAEMGCEVHGYDHTIKANQIRTQVTENFVSWHLGMGIVTDLQKNIIRLKDALAKNGHTGRTIHYLKIDIEGEEKNSIPDWIESGALDNVEQIGMEVHLQQKHKWLDALYISHYQSLYKIGFRLISWDPNVYKGIVNKKSIYMELVFKKNNTGICSGFIA